MKLDELNSPGRLTRLAQQLTLSLSPDSHVKQSIAYQCQDDSLEH